MITTMECALLIEIALWQKEMTQEMVSVLLHILYLY